MEYGDSAAQVMEPDQVLRVRIREHPVLELIQLLREIFHHREVAIHERVDEGIREIIGPARADRTDARANPLAHGVEESEITVLEGDQIVTRPFVEPFSIDLSLAWRRDSYLSRANQVFRDFVLEEVKNNSYNRFRKI